MSVLWDWFYNLLASFGLYHKNAKILFLGLDNAGKTTLLRMLKDNRAVSAEPTIHPNTEELIVGHLKLKAFDLGGHETARRLWQDYTTTVDGVVFLVDAIDRQRFPEAKRELDNLLSSDEIRATSPSLDINATFSPRPLWAMLPIKFLMMGGSIAILVLDVLREPSIWWMAYFSNWGWSCVVAYFLCSFACGASLARWPRDYAGLLVKSVWTLFAISLPSQIIVMLMYYTLEFDGSVDFISIVKHGAAIPVLLFDGFAINRIPLRMKQFGLYQSFVVAFLAWSIAYAYSGLNISGEQETIYEWLDWKTDIHSAALLSLFGLVIVNPAVFVGCRATSRMLPRRLQTKSVDTRDIAESSTADVQDEVDITHDLEEGDVSYEDKVDVRLSSMTVPSIPMEEEVSTPKTIKSEQDEEIEDMASFPEIIYDDGDANMSQNSSYNEETQASSAQASSRIDAYIGVVEKPYEDLKSFPGYNEEDGNDTDYSFDKEGVDISSEREISHASIEPDMVSFPDLLAP